MRSRFTAAVGTALFFVVAPGVGVGLIPWWLTGWEMAEPLPFWIVARVLGAILICAGLTVLVHAFTRFVLDGIGTPMPVAPPQHLVVGGFNRYVRNPMYVAFITTVIGESLMFGQVILLGYAAVVWTATATFVRSYEEPHLVRQFGAEYEAYRRAVPAWLPRLHPWNPGDRHQAAAPHKY